MKKIISFKSLFNLTKLSILGLSLSACGGDTAKEIDKDINNADKDRQSSVKFINASNTELSFFAHYFGISETIFDSKYELTTLLKEETSDSINYSWNSSLSQTEFAVIDTNTRSQHATTKYKVSHNNSYIGIAWLDQENLTISIVQPLTIKEQDLFSLRLFASNDLQINFSNESFDSTFASKGALTDVIKTENCADFSEINGIDNNFCTVANIGHNYVGVIKNNGTVVFIQE